MLTLWLFFKVKLFLKKIISSCLYSAALAVRVCVAFSTQIKEGSHPIRGNLVNVADTVPSAYLQLVLNNRKPGEMSSPIITPGLFFPSSPYSILAPRSKDGMLNHDLISEGASRV